MGASFQLSYTVIRKFSTFKNKGTSLWNFLQILDLENFATAYRSPERVINFAGRSQRDKQDRRRSTKLIIPKTSDAWPL